MFPCRNGTGPTGCRPSIAGQKMCLGSSRWRSKLQDRSHMSPSMYGTGPTGSQPSIKGKKLILEAAGGALQDSCHIQMCLRLQLTEQISHVSSYTGHTFPDHLVLNTGQVSHVFLHVAKSSNKCMVGNSNVSVVATSRTGLNRIGPTFSNHLVLNTKVSTPSCT